MCGDSDGGVQGHRRWDLGEWLFLPVGFWTAEGFVANLLSY